MAQCRICKQESCNDDCEELSLIYREQLREKLADVELEDEEICACCGNYNAQNAQWSICQDCQNDSDLYDLEA